MSSIGNVSGNIFEGTSTVTGGCKLFDNNQVDGNITLTSAQVTGNSFHGTANTFLFGSVLGNLIDGECFVTDVELSANIIVGNVTTKGDCVISGNLIQASIVDTAGTYSAFNILIQGNNIGGNISLSGSVLPAACTVAINSNIIAGNLSLDHFTISTVNDNTVKGTVSCSYGAFLINGLSGAGAVTLTAVSAVTLSDSTIPSLTFASMPSPAQIFLSNLSISGTCTVGSGISVVSSTALTMQDCYLGGAFASVGVSDVTATNCQFESTSSFTYGHRLTLTFSSFPTNVPAISLSGPDSILLASGLHIFTAVAGGTYSWAATVIEVSNSIFGWYNSVGSPYTMTFTTTGSAASRVVLSECDLSSVLYTAVGGLAGTDLYINESRFNSFIVNCVLGVCGVTGSVFKAIYTNVSSTTSTGLGINGADSVSVSGYFFYTNDLTKASGINCANGQLRLFGAITKAVVSGNTFDAGAPGYDFTTGHHWMEQLAWEGTVKNLSVVNNLFRAPYSLAHDTGADTTMFFHYYGGWSGDPSALYGIGDYFSGNLMVTVEGGVDVVSSAYGDAYELASFVAIGGTPGMNLYIYNGGSFLYNDPTLPEMYALSNTAPS